MRGRKPSPNPKVSLTLQVDPKFLDRLNEAAREAKISRARWVTLVLEDVLDSIPPDPALDTVKAGGKGMGSGGSGAKRGKGTEAGDGVVGAEEQPRKTIVWDGSTL